MCIIAYNSCTYRIAERCEAVVFFPFLAHKKLTKGVNFEITKSYSSLNTYNFQVYLSVSPKFITLKHVSNYEPNLPATVSFYVSKMSKIENREVNGPSNIGLFALEDISKDAIIMRESPFYSFGMENIRHYMMNENPTGNSVLDAEIRELQTKIGIANKKYHKKGASFKEKYPAEARVLLDRIAAIISEKEFESESKDVQEKWLALHDAHQDVRKDTTIGIFGLTSEKGKLLNGKIAHCRGFDKSKQRYIVEYTDQSPENPEKVLLKKENVKTVSGVFRSNAFPEGLFENRCRMNHACKANTETLSVLEYNQRLGGSLIAKQPNECITIAKENIKVGDELTGCYISIGSGKSVDMRREELREKYRFDCQCELCCNELTEKM